VDYDWDCGPGWECPPSSVCMTGNYNNPRYPTWCACVTANNIADRVKLGWRPKFPIARVDLPRREMAALVPPRPIPYPTTPDQLQELLLPKFKMPPWISKIITGGGNDDPLPDHPPPFPYSCEDLLYRPGGLGSPQGTDRFCRMLQPTAKVWNPTDPCLKRAAKEHWDGIDATGKYYQDAHMLNARSLYNQLLRIEGERLACRAGCNPQWPTACASACDETAETLKRNWNRAYQDEEERLDEEQKVVGENLSRAFWAAARACGYDDGSFGVEGTSNGRGWGGPVPILREEGQA